MRQFDNLLPVEDPTQPENQPSQQFFYDRIAKPLIPHIIDIMNQGIQIDLDEVEVLRSSIDEILEGVQSTIDNNEIILNFQKMRFPLLKKNYIAEQEAKQRSIAYYKKEFKPKDMSHRSYYMNVLLSKMPDPDISYWPEGILPNGHTKWAAKDVTKFLENNPSVSYEDPSIAEEAMEALATDKRDLYNQPYKTAIADVTPKQLLGQFNPGSSQQKQLLFEYLDIESEEFSKDTGLPSWSREQIERVQRESSDPILIELLQAFIDHSFAAIIRSNFLAAFDRFIIDGVLYGNLKLGGAKSFRLTSDKPNMLNMPSSRSIYAKPLKKCLIAPPGFIVATADYSALEEVVAANITKDENKIKILGGGYDSHCFHTLYYWREQVEAILGPSDDSIEYNKRFKAMSKTDKVLDELRSKSKPVSFGLAYGCMPAKVSKSIKGTPEEGELIYDRYHGELYPGITRYREQYILKTAQQEGSIHLGFGLRLKTNNASKDIRTLNNATIQFWSVLTLLALARVNERIVEAGLEEDIQCVSTIYDSIYYNCRNDAKIVDWLNRTLIEVMIDPFMTDQPVPNLSALDIGPNWADLTELPNNCSIEHIQKVLDETCKK